MEQTAANILKSTDFELDGQFHLELNSMPAGPGAATGNGPTLPKACIVENHPEFALLEITCPCGTKSYVRCHYAGIQTDNTNDNKKNEVGETKNAS